MVILAVTFPGLALLLDGYFGAAMVCLALQLSVVGWPLASRWAMTVVRRGQEERRYAGVGKP
jgi:hypothetical protein